ncbi:MAG: NUDIX domain-containing protein [Patescibacteria group bacterium]
MSDEPEVEIYSSKFLRLTTQQRGEKVFDRVYIRDSVSVIILPSPRVIRFIKEESGYGGNPRLKLVSGYIEDDERASNAVQRELKEELGLIAGYWNMFLLSETPKEMVRKRRYYYTASDLVNCKSSPEEGEKILGYEDLSFEEVKERVLSLQFGTTETAFTLLKFVSEKGA